MIPEGYRPRKGDVVIHATATRDARPGDDSMTFKIEGTYSNPIIDYAQIKGVFSRHWEPGDQVRSIHDHDDRGEVIATQDDQVWVKLPHGGMQTFTANDLEDVPPAPPVAMHETPPADACA